MRYRKICEVREMHLDLPVCLRLQVRLDVPPVKYYTLSWRSRYRTSPGQNRRLYETNADGFWTVPVDLAVHILEQASDRGLLDTGYDDPGTRHGGTENYPVADSRALSSVGRRYSLDEITFDDEDWGLAPVFVIAETPDGKWRKIMIVNTERNVCTFRSMTTDGGYGMKGARRRIGRWFLDRSMQDASAAVMRQFLAVLRVDRQ